MKPEATFRLDLSRRVLFLTKDPETIRKQLRDFDTILAPAHDRGVRDGSRFPGHVH